MVNRRRANPVARQEYLKKRKENLTLHGTCYVCARRPIDHSRSDTKCSLCIDRNTQMAKESRADRSSRVLSGFCRNCGKNPIDYVRSKSRCTKCIDSASQRSLEHYHATKFVVLYYYSHGELRCNCCGCNDFDFLTIDHINHGSGSNHYMNLSSTITSWLYHHLGVHGFQVLCQNCNSSRGKHNGVCIHELRKTY